jgi:hypothetical protein
MIRKIQNQSPDLTGDRCRLFAPRESFGRG